jgi:phosphoribulokinase
VELEEAIWDRMQFASHLRTQRLGEFTIGSDLHRSEALGLTQLLLLYHLVTARAVIALGGQSARATTQPSADRSVPDPVPASNS